MFIFVGFDFWDLYWYIGDICPFEEDILWELWIC